MKPQLTVWLTLAALALGLGAFKAGDAGAAVSIQKKSPTTLAAKRCEKCRRGDDGKMVCEPVPCP
ncbi:MAG TPA: hypothetical protein VFW62_10575 [bacterium]|nr:hypothetical protein [bacterium]